MSTNLRGYRRQRSENADNGGGVLCVCAEQQADIIQMMSYNDFGMLMLFIREGWEQSLQLLTEILNRFFIYSIIKES